MARAGAGVALTGGLGGATPAAIGPGGFAAGPARASGLAWDNYLAPTPRV